MIVNDTHYTEIHSPYQKISGIVFIYNSDGTEYTRCTCADVLSDFTIERAGEGKFFGYGICQKLRVSLIDINRELDITKEHKIRVAFIVNNGYEYPFANYFYIDELERDEVSNLITITAYDALYKMATHTASEIDIDTGYLNNMAIEIAEIYGLTTKIDDATYNAYHLYIKNKVNLDGTENLRDILNKIAEMTQTIYFINNRSQIYFRRLDKGAEPVYTIEKNRYYDLQCTGARTLANITSTTELGDNVSTIAPDGLENGVTQFIRDNPFLELRDDVASILDSAQSAVGETVINEFECNWIGNYLLELGDKIELIKDDNSSVVSYILDDTISYDGTLSQFTRWTYDKNDTETASNPTTLGEALNKTVAKVDKVSQEITLTVTNIERAVEAKVDKQGFNITVSDTLKENDIEGIKIKAKNYMFNEHGMTIAAQGGTGEQMHTLINEGGLYVYKDGQTELTANYAGIIANNLTIENENFTLSKHELMYSADDEEIETRITGEGVVISKNGEDVFIADNTGVNATNLYATTYLMIGANSRFETYRDEYGNTRTACFWIG